MRIQLTERGSRYSPSFVAYLLAAIRIANGMAMLLPAFVLAKWLGVSYENHFGQISTSLCLLNALLGVLIFQALGLYGPELFNNRLQSRKILVAWLITFCLILSANTAFTLVPLVTFGGWLFWFVAGFLLLVLQRLILLGLFRYLIQHRGYLQNTAILGCNDNGMMLAQYMRKNDDIRSGFLGFIDDRTISRLPCLNSTFPYLGTIDDLVALVRKERIQQILVALPWSAVIRMGDLTDALKRLPVNVLLAPDMHAFRYAHSRVTYVAGLPMFNISELPLAGWSSTVKRLEDIFLSSIALIVLAPLMLIIALMVKIDSPGPAIFRQKRYGYNNKLIEVYKFRTMHQSMADADASTQTVKRDPRITRMGKFLRRSSLDELPQLLNVLLGNMSIVGPRPHARATKAAGVLFEDAVAEYTARHRVKPGITGWAQVNNCRGETDTLEKLEKRIEYDLEYIESWSVWFDLNIVARTVPSLVFSKEAY